MKKFLPDYFRGYQGLKSLRGVAASEHFLNIEFRSAAGNKPYLPADME